MGLLTLRFDPSPLPPTSPLLGSYVNPSLSLHVYSTPAGLSCQEAKSGLKVPLAVAFPTPTDPTIVKSLLLESFGLFSRSFGLKIALRARGGGALCCARESYGITPSSEVIEFLKRPGDPFDYIHRKATSQVNNQALAEGLATGVLCYASRGETVGMKLAEMENIPQVTIRDPMKIAMRLLIALGEERIWTVASGYLVRFQIARLARRYLTDAAFMRKEEFFNGDNRDLAERLEELMKIALERDREWPESGTIMQIGMMQKLISVTENPESWWKSLFCYTPSLLAAYVSQYPVEKLPHYHHICALDVPSLIGKKHIFELQMLLDNVYFALGCHRSSPSIQESAICVLSELLAAREDFTITYLTICCLEWVIHRGKLSDLNLRKLGILIEDLLNSSSLSSNFRLCEVLASLLVKLSKQDQMTNMLDHCTFQLLELDKRVVSILALSPTELCIEPPYCNLQFEDAFVGRENQLEQARRQLIVRKITTIAGETGIGKTALACHLAYLLINNYYIVWLCDAETESKLSLSLQSLAKRLGLPFDTLHDFLPRINSPKVLLILDNLCHSLSDDVKSLLTGATYVVITSRSNYPEYAVRLQGLESDTAVDLVARLAQRETEKPDIDLLCRELGYVPLALKFAAKLLRGAPAESVKGMIQFVRGSPEASDEANNSGAVGTIAKLIEKCVERVECPGTKLLLQATAQISLESVPVIVYKPIFHTQFPDADLHAAISEAMGFTLLQVDEAENLSVNTLVRTTVLKLTSQQEKDALFSSTVSVLLSLFQREDLSPATRALSKVVETAVSCIQDKPSPSEVEFHLTLQYLYYYMKAKGTYKYIASLYDKTMAWFDSRMKTSPRAADYLHTMSVIQLKAGKLEEAESVGQACISLYESHGEANSPGYALALSQFAAVLQGHNRLVEAEKYCMQAISIQNEVLSPMDPQIAISYVGLAGILMAKRMTQEAEVWVCKALQLQERALGPQHPDLAATFLTLSIISQSQGRLSESETFALRSKAIQETLLGDSHPKLATTYTTLAGLYQAQKKINEAENYSLKALRILENLYGSAHPQLIPVLASLTAIYSYKNRLPEAEKYALQRLNIQEASLGTNHPVQGALYFDLAEIYNAQGKVAEAELFALKALRVQENSLPRTHPQFATTYSLLATIYLARQKPLQAEKFALDALYTQEALYGKHDPELVHCYSLLSSICISQGRFSDALDFTFDILKIKKRFLGKKHVDLVPHYLDLSDIYTKAEQLPEAEKKALKALKLLEKAGNEKSAQVSKAISILISIYMAQNRLSDAEKFYIKALNHIEINSPTEVDELAIGYQSLANVCRAQGKHSEAGKYAIKARNLSSLS